jgi:site-specific recombinase XerC
LRAGSSEEKELLRRNPARGVEIPAQAILASRGLDAEQRYVLRELVEQANDPRGAALFALGYWAGCRVSDVSWLLLEHTHVSPKQGWLHVGHKGGKTARDRSYQRGAQAAEDLP